MIVGIDPSFSGTGLAVLSDDLSTIYYTEKYDSECDVYHKHDYTDGAFKVCERVFYILKDLCCKYPTEQLHVIAEIPALATKSGSYLAVIHGMLDYFFKTTALPIVDCVWVPCTACDSFTGNKKHSKTYLVNYCFDNNWTDKKKTSHDICTAIIFCHLYKAILNKRYRNSYFIYKR